MSYNNTVNWIKVHSTQNCCFSYVYFSMQRVYYLVFVYENDKIVRGNDKKCAKLSILLIIKVFPFD